ncbi:uncharacterized protein SRS1_10770 [Sporisorium reilianum f. sp. reilianum]|uniref:Uncharacterized protein n=1 Tax=Sporisorium reilianum f. sp. reilianum TaxID=72559 RepID=A0A2N8UC59_9BASI|nr:uncharacterized protein SRS1_10770 [Sporisorium reilianum f. sp. reilianum]
MFRALAGRSLLLVALVSLLLWASFCVSAPTQDYSLEAYLQNVPHYNNLPIFNVLMESPDAIEYSRKKLPAVWLTQPNVHADEPYQVFKYEQGERKKAEAASPYDTIGVKQKLAEAGVTGNKYGEAAKLLQHGRPFAGTRMGAYTWLQVWSQPVSHSVPLTRGSSEWLAIRSRLQENKRIVLHDQNRNTVLGFRILHDGKVEVDIKSLAHGLRKRAFTESGQQLVESSASGSGAASLDKLDVARLIQHLQKLPDHFKPPVNIHVHGWEKVWERPFPIDLPSTSTSEKWEGIRNTLWGNGKVVINDPVTKELLGIKFDENGSIKTQVKHYTNDLIEFTHRFHRRDLASLFESTAPDGTPRPAAISSVDTKLEAHIQGRPHYLGFPVLKDTWEDDRSIDYALQKNPAVWLTKSSFRREVPLEVELVRPKRLRQLMDSHAVPVKDLLHNAEVTRNQYGDAAQYLQFGQPFKETGVEPVDWQDVWGSKPINVRPNLEPEGWIQIREKLQQNRHILLHDEGRNLKLAFRLNKAGQVELVINHLKHGILKRSEASSAKSASGTSVDSEVSHGTLVKRAPTSSSSRMNAFLHLLIPDRGQKGNEGDKKLYADLLHYNGVPIINADIHSTDLGRKALRDYGNFWVYEKLDWQNHIEGNPFHHRFAGPAASVITDENEAVFNLVQTAKRFGDAHGDVAAKLAYGAPFPKSRRTAPADWDLAMKFDSTTMDIHEARAKLQQFTRIVLNNPATGLRVGFELNSEGKVLVHKFSSTAHHLIKRMYVPTDAHRWYAMYHQYVAPSEPLTAEAARQMFAGTIHHKGEPVLYVGEFDNDMLNHAISRYGGAWIALRDGTKEPIHVDQRNGRGASGWLDLHYHLNQIAQDRASYGDIPALLMHGKPFAPRPSSRFGGYSRPKFTGTAFKNSHLWDLSQHQDLYRMHKYLDDHNYLKGWYPRTGQVFGLRLNKQGAVEIQHLAVLSRPLRKSSDFSSAEGSSSASRSSGAGHLAKRMQGASHPPEGSYEWYGRMYWYKAPTMPFTVDNRQDTETLSTIYHKGIPVFLADNLPRSQVDHALAQHGSAWISGKDGSNAYHRPFLVNPENEHIRSNDWDKVVQHLQDAERDRTLYGDTLMYLKHGQPFAPRQPVEAPSSSRTGRFRFKKSKAYNVPDWQEVLNKGTQVDLDNVDLSYFRRHLNQHNFLVATTSNPGKRFGVRLDAAGGVELRDLSALVRHMRKRAVEENVSSLDRSSGSHQLAKQMASTDVQPGTYEWYVEGYRHRPQAPSTAATSERMFADTIFHGRVPVLVAEKVDVAKVDRALTNYGAAWITSRDQQGNLREPFYLTPNGVDPNHGHTNIWRNVRAMDQYGKDYGSVAMLLMYGKPFPPQTPTSFLKSALPKAFRKEKGAYDLSTSDPYLARQNLRKTKRMTGWSSITKKLYDIQLLDDGKVVFNEFKSAGGRLHRRMELPPGSSTDPVPRPSTDPTSDPRAIEYYIFHEHRGVAAPTLTDVERRKFFAGDLHFGGMPMFWPEKDANVLRKIEQAQPYYPGYWIVGSFRNDPNRLTATYKELDPRRRGDRKVGEQDLLEELLKMHEYGDAHGHDAMLLKYGPGFPRRQSSGLLRSYNTPKWHMAKARAPRVPADTPISNKWDMLHVHNMLAFEDKGSTIMLALEKSGGVVRLIDPQSVALHKRMESSSDPVEQPSSDPDPVEQPSSNPWEDPAAIEHYIYPDISKGNDRPSHPLTELDRNRFFAGDIHFNGNPVFFPASDPKVPIKTWRAKVDYPGYWIVGSLHNDLGTRTAAFMVGGARGYGDDKALEHVAAVEQYGQRHNRDTMLLKYGPSFPKRQNPSRWSMYKTPNMREVLSSAPRLTAADPSSQKWEMLHRNNMLVIQDGYKNAVYALDRLGKVVEPVKEETRFHKRTAPKHPTRTIEYFINRRHSDDNSVVPLSDVKRRRYFAGDLHYKGVPMFFPEMDEHVLAKVQQARRNYPGYWILGSSLHDNIIDTATYVPSDRSLPVSKTGEDDVLDGFGAMIRYRNMHGEDAQLLTYGPGFPKGRSKIKSWTNAKKSIPPSAATMSDKWSELYQHGILKINNEQGAVGFVLDQTGHLSHMRFWILPSKVAVPLL